MENSFDLNSWKKQGEDALAVLRDKECRLSEELQSVKTEMEGLEKVLSINVNGKRSRVKIRPAIVEVLGQVNGSIGLEQLVSGVKEVLPLASRFSIEKAVLRFLAISSDFDLSVDGASIIRTIAPAEETTEQAPQ